MYDLLVEPFTYMFMKRTLVSCLCLALSCGPVGIFLILRRMSLMGDALSHSVLPGAAVGYVIAGLSLFAMGLGGIISGLCVAILSGLVSRFTHLKEDASFAGFFIISVGLGVLIISMRHNPIDLMHVLFGNALAVNSLALNIMAAITTLTLLILALIYRPLVMECFDSNYYKSIQRKGSFHHIVFLFLVVINLIAGFQALGTLLSLGMMILPALTARFWTRRLASMIVLAILIALLGSFCGLLVAYHQNLPTGPSIVLIIGVAYVISLVLGTRGSILRTIIHKHSA